MSKTLLILLLLLVSILTRAQSFAPTTLWPYLNADFRSALVYVGGKSEAAVVNIHLLRGELHRLNEGNIEAINQRPDSVVIANALFIPVDGCLCQVLGRANGQSGSVIVVKKVIGDFNKLMSGTGAYGATLNTSGRTELTSLEIGGISQTNHGILLQERDNSKLLPLTTSRLVILLQPDGSNKIAEASARDVRSLVAPDRQDALKAALKAAKIKWNRDDSAAQSAAIIAQFL